MARTAAATRDGQAARQRILQAAVEVMASRGYRAASIDAVARSAGLTKAGVLHHFPNKEAILLALLDARDKELHILEPEPSGVDPLANARRSMLAIMRRRELMMLSHLLTAEGADANHPAHAWLVDRYRKVRRMMSTLLRGAQDAGDLAAGIDVEQLAALHLAVIEGLEAQWLADPESVDVEACLMLFERLTNAASSVPPEHGTDDAGTEAGSAGDGPHRQRPDPHPADHHSDQRQGEQEPEESAR